MEQNEKENQFTLLYIQKQEQLMLELIRKTLNNDVQTAIVNSNYQGLQQKFSELERSSVEQNKIVEQATNSIKELNIRSANYDKLRMDYTELSRKHDQLTKMHEEIKTNNQDLLKEMDRQRLEMQTIFQENLELQRQLDRVESQSSIAKKEKPKPKKALDDDTF